MDNYWEKMKMSATDMTKKSKEKRYEAYVRAHEMRKFEIKLFWRRATYYWAFILAAFTAHFALLGMLFNGKDFSIPELYKLPGLSLFALAITALFCFVFSFCWVLMNKGSKFWQKNWERHIDELQNEFSGDLYKVILNTKNKSSFKSCPIRLYPYDYSVSKITMVTSVVLMLAAGAMFGLYIAVMFSKCIFGANVVFSDFGDVRWWIEIVVLLFFLILFVSFVCRLVEGNEMKNTMNLFEQIIFCFSKDNAIETSSGDWINLDEIKREN